MDQDDGSWTKARPRLRPGGSPNSPNGGSSYSVPDQAYCLRRAEMLFGCYRKDEANNPEIYTAAIAATLRGFETKVIDLVTDPRTGLPSRCKWPPSVSEVKEACEIESAKFASAQRFSERKPVYARGVDTTTPGRRANLFVSASAPQYGEVVEWSYDADPADYRGDPAGIWVNWQLSPLARLLPARK